MNSRFSAAFRLVAFFVLASFCGSNTAYSSENGVPNPLKKKDDKIAQGFEPKQIKQRDERHEGMIQKKGDNESLKMHLHEKSDKKEDHEKSDDKARETRIRESQENESEDHDDFESKEHSIKNDLKDKRVESKGLSKPDDKDEDEHDSKDKAESSFKDHHSRRGHQDRDRREDAPDSEDHEKDHDKVSRDDSTHDSLPKDADEDTEKPEQPEQSVNHDSTSKELEKEIETAKIEAPELKDTKDIKENEVPEPVIQDTEDAASQLLRDVILQGPMPAAGDALNPGPVTGPDPVTQEITSSDLVDPKAQDIKAGLEPVAADGAKEVFMIEPVLIAEPIPPSGPASGFVAPGDTIGPGPVTQEITASDLVDPKAEDIKAGLEPVAVDSAKETFIPEPVVEVVAEPVAGAPFDVPPGPSGEPIDFPGPVPGAPVDGAPGPSGEPIDFPFPVPGEGTPALPTDKLDQAAALAAADAAARAAAEAAAKSQEPVGQPTIAPEPVVGGDPGMISIPGPFLESDPLSGQPAPDDGNLKPLPVLIEDPLLAKKPILVPTPGLPALPPGRRIVIPGPITGPDPVLSDNTK